MVLELARTDAVAPRSDFPILSRTIHDRPLIYLDSAATSLKPRAVLEAMNGYHERFSGNVFRGNHLLAEEASDAYDHARTVIAEHLRADPLEITFWNNTTDAINAVARGLQLTAADRVVVPISEHHSNYVPWLQNASVDAVPVDEQGFVDPQDVRARLEASSPARLVAVAHVSNVTGAIQDIPAIADVCHEHGVPLLVDGAQGCPHLPVDVGQLGCNYYAFSGHKMLGPTGVGVLWARYEDMEVLQPVRVGGGMVMRVLHDRFETKDPPHGFEAGTPNIAGVIGLGAAVDYLQQFPVGELEASEHALARRMLERAVGLPRVSVLGPKSAERRISLVTLLVDGAQTADHVSLKLSDRFAVMTRSGTHCAQPYFHFIGRPTGLRLSAYVYTTLDEVDQAFDAIETLLAG